MITPSVVAALTSTCLVDETQASQKQNCQPRSRKIAKAKINLYSTPLTRLYSDWLNSKLPRETKSFNLFFILDLLLTVIVATEVHRERIDQSERRIVR